MGNRRRSGGRGRCFQFSGFLSIWELNILAATLDGAGVLPGELRVDLFQLAFINRHFIRAMGAIDGENSIREFGRLIFHNELTLNEANAGYPVGRGKITV